MERSRFLKRLGVLTGVALVTSLSCALVFATSFILTPFEHGKWSKDNLCEQLPPICDLLPPDECLVDIRHSFDSGIIEIHTNLREVSSRSYLRDLKERAISLGYTVKISEARNLYIQGKQINLTVRDTDPLVLVVR